MNFTQSSQNSALCDFTGGSYRHQRGAQRRRHLVGHTDPVKPTGRAARDDPPVPRDWSRGILAPSIVGHAAGRLSTGSDPFPSASVEEWARKVRVREGPRRRHDRIVYGDRPQFLAERKLFLCLPESIVFQCCSRYPNNFQQPRMRVCRKLQRNRITDRVSLDAQVYAGAVSTAQTGSGMRARTVLRSPVLSMSTTSAAIQPIALTAQLNDTTSLNLTTMSSIRWDCRGRRTVRGSASEPSAYRCRPTCRCRARPCSVAMPSPSRAASSFFRVSFLRRKSAAVLLSPKYLLYQGGEQPEGLPVDYDPNPSTSAVCDFTTGYRTIIVQYNPDGTFSLVSST